MSAPDVIAITDPRWSDEELAQRAEAILRAVPVGSVAFQVRDKVRSARLVLSLAERLRAVCRQYQSALYVNDRLDIALAVGAEGVHLGDKSVDVSDARALLGPDAFISMSAHQLDDIERARSAGASAVLVSPIYATPGKGTPRGAGFVSQAKDRAGRVRVYALGGIDLGKIDECRRAGADGVALIRALWDSSDPSSAARQLVDAVRAFPS